MSDHVCTLSYSTSVMISEGDTANARWTGEKILRSKKIATIKTRTKEAYFVFIALDIINSIAIDIFTNKSSQYVQKTAVLYCNSAENRYE